MTAAAAASPTMRDSMWYRHTDILYKLEWPVGEVEFFKLGVQQCCERYSEEVVERKCHSVQTTRGYFSAFFSSSSAAAAASLHVVWDFHQPHFNKYVMPLNETRPSPGRTPLLEELLCGRVSTVSHRTLRKRLKSNAQLCHNDLSLLSGRCDIVACHSLSAPLKEFLNVFRPLDRSTLMWRGGLFARRGQGLLRCSLAFKFNCWRANILGAVGWICSARWVNFVNITLFKNFQFP